MEKWIIGLILVSGLFSCGKMKDPVFKGIENVKMDGIGMQESFVTLDIRYLNPNSFAGKLKNAEGDAWVDSVFLGHFFVDSLVNIPANQDFLVPVKLKVDMKQMLRHSLTAFMKEEVLLRISGKAKAGRSGVFRNFSLNYSGKQNLQELFNKAPGLRL
jgi:LEA14-like dessication related protein